MIEGEKEEEEHVLYVSLNRGSVLQKYLTGRGVRSNHGGSKRHQGDDKQNVPLT
jgi:hypothetical protein